MDGLAGPVPVLVRGGRVEGDGVARPELVQLETHVGLQVPADDDAVFVPVVPDRAPCGFRRVPIRFVDHFQEIHAAVGSGG